MPPSGVKWWGGLIAEQWCFHGMPCYSQFQLGGFAEGTFHSEGPKSGKEAEIKGEKDDRKDVGNSKAKKLLNVSKISQQKKKGK